MEPCTFGYTFDFIAFLASVICAFICVPGFILAYFVGRDHEKRRNVFRGAP